MRQWLFVLDVTSTLVTTAAMKDALNAGLVKSTGNNIGPISNEINQLSNAVLVVT